MSLKTKIRVGLMGHFARRHTLPLFTLTMTLCSQFSYGATDLELTAKPDRYPLFFRTVPTDFVFNEPRLRFIQRFGWKDEIGMIYDASPYYSRVGHYLNWVSFLCHFLTSQLLLQLLLRLTEFD